MSTGNGFDFVMIDGPNDEWGRSKGIRDNEVAIEEISTFTREADVVIIDDVHRRHILDTVDRSLVHADQYDKWFFDYSVVTSHANSLCISTRKSSLASLAMPKIQEMLGIPLYPIFQREDCPED